MTRGVAPLAWTNTGREQEKNVSLPPLVEPAAELSVDEVRRYSRHLIIPDVGMAGQKRLKNARVLVIGAGGLGSPALMYLAAAGVGTLGVVDFDVVDESNLQRQVIHGQSDIGTPKALSAKASVAEINPYVTVVVHEERLDNDNVMRIFADYDLIVDGTDNFATRYLVNDACVLLGKPYVLGVDLPIRRPGVSVLGCARALLSMPLPRATPPGMVPSCAEGGVLGVLCASVGSVQVTEAIKLLTGIGEPLLGRLMVYDALETSYRTVTVRKDPECAICGVNPTVTELVDYEAFCGVISAEAAEAAVDSTISVHTLADWLSARERGERDFVLVDVREPVEYAINRIPGSVLIPKGEFLTGEALPKLPVGQAGGAALQGRTSLGRGAGHRQGRGYADAVHVGGGVAAWVRQIDPSQPAY